MDNKVIIMKVPPNNQMIITILISIKSVIWWGGNVQIYITVSHYNDNRKSHWTHQIGPESFFYFFLYLLMDILLRWVITNDHRIDTHIPGTGGLSSLGWTLTNENAGFPVFIRWIGAGSPWFLPNSTRPSSAGCLIVVCLV